MTIKISNGYSQDTEKKNANIFEIARVEMLIEKFLVKNDFNEEEKEVSRLFLVAAANAE